MGAFRKVCGVDRNLPKRSFRELQGEGRKVPHGDSYSFLQSGSKWARCKTGVSSLQVSAFSARTWHPGAVPGFVGNQFGIFVAPSDLLVADGVRLGPVPLEGSANGILLSLV